MIFLFIYIFYVRILSCIVDDYKLMKTLLVIIQVDTMVMMSLIVALLHGSLNSEKPT